MSQGKHEQTKRLKDISQKKSTIISSGLTKSRFVSSRRYGAMIFGNRICGFYFTSIEECHLYCI